MYNTGPRPAREIPHCRHAVIAVASLLSFDHVVAIVQLKLAVHVEPLDPFHFGLPLQGIRRGCIPAIWEER